MEIERDKTTKSGVATALSTTRTLTEKLNSVDHTFADQVAKTFLILSEFFDRLKPFLSQDRQRFSAGHCFKIREHASRLRIRVRNLLLVMSMPDSVPDLRSATREVLNGCDGEMTFENAYNAYKDFKEKRSK